MPMNKALYPPNWKEIARAAKTRAGWKCEQCGVPHKALILRSDIDPARWLMFDEDGVPVDYRGRHYRMSGIPAEYESKLEYTTVILTTHHKGIPKPDGSPGSVHDKMDNRPENLAALCQRCHLAADKPYHIAAMIRTVSRKKHESIEAAGQSPLFSDD